MSDLGLLVKNYKCFDEKGIELGGIMPINIIIGKNNSGKSSLIDIIRSILSKDPNIFSVTRNGKAPEIIFTHRFDKSLIATSFPKNTSGGDIIINHFQYGESFDGMQFTFKFNNSFEKEFISIGKRIASSSINYFNNYVRQLKIPFENKHFGHISAERDIVPEGEGPNLNLSINGNGATDYIQQIINKVKFDSDLVEGLLLTELNKIINPDIYFKRILVQKSDNGSWEICFDDMHDGRIPLSKMGSGVKTILLVLLHLLVKPVIESKKAEDYIFAFEELENNLHPSLQRRLYQYIYNYAETSKAIFFLTTHSNIVIDVFTTLPKTQIFHIQKVKNSTTLSSVNSHNNIKSILEDLEIRASDILQSNGIIWVEGPSDRVYINKWLNLIAPSLIEGYHYSIMFYGGRLLSNLSFNAEYFDTNLIPLLKLNRNAFVVMDRDGRSMAAKLNSTKLRIAEEIGADNVWVTKGREIENYLSASIVEKWLKNDYELDCKIMYDKNKPFDETLLTSLKKTNLTYSKNKNFHAANIAKYITAEDLKFLDLKNKVENIVSTIQLWNKK